MNWKHRVFVFITEIFWQTFWHNNWRPIFDVVKRLLLFLRSTLLVKLHFDYLNFRTKSSFLIHSEMPHSNSLFTPVTIAPGVHELTTLIMTTCFDEKKIEFEQCICNNQHTLTRIDIIHIDHWYLLYFDHNTYMYLDLIWGWLVSLNQCGWTLEMSLLQKYLKKV